MIINKTNKYDIFELCWKNRFQFWVAHTSFLKKLRNYCISERATSKLHYLCILYYEHFSLI